MALREQCTRKELIIFFFVEPGALDVEEFETGHADGERERIDRELGDWLIRARIGFVIQDVDGVISNLQTDLLTCLPMVQIDADIVTKHQICTIEVALV